MILEGEYANGKINGKVKEYNDDGSLKFEDDYLNGKRWNGKAKDIGNNFLFEGEYVNGKGNGKLISYYYYYSE